MGGKEDGVSKPVKLTEAQRDWIRVLRDMLDERGL